MHRENVWQMQKESWLGMINIVWLQVIQLQQLQQLQLGMKQRSEAAVHTKKSAWDITYQHPTPSSSSFLPADSIS